MATGDVTLFNSLRDNLGAAIHNFNSDDTFVGLVTNTSPPTQTTAVPHWAGTGTTNLATNQVGTGGGYTGPVNCSAVITDNWSISGATATYDIDDVSLSQNASGFTDAYWAVGYNNTDVNKRAIFFCELGGPVSLVAGDVSISWNASGVFTLS
jgi:hypothetical protein